LETCNYRVSRELPNPRYGAAELRATESWEALTREGQSKRGEREKGAWGKWNGVSIKKRRSTT